MTIHAESLESLARQLSDEATDVAYAMQESCPAHSAMIARLASMVDSLLDALERTPESVARQQVLSDFHSGPARDA